MATIYTHTHTHTYLGLIIISTTCTYKTRGLAASRTRPTIKKTKMLLGPRSYTAVPPNNPSGTGTQLSPSRTTHTHKHEHTHKQGHRPVLLPEKCTEPAAQNRKICCLHRPCFRPPFTHIGFWFCAYMAKQKKYRKKKKHGTSLKINKIYTMVSKTRNKSRGAKQDGGQGKRCREHPKIIFDW